MNIESTTQPWPHKNDVVFKIEINPAKRPKILRNVLILGAAVLSIGFALSDNGPLMSWAHDYEAQIHREALEPTMRKLADQGQASAVIWLSQNFKDEDSTRLQALADAGNGEALFTLAWTKYAKDEPARESLITRAADAGVAPAIRMVQARQKSN